MLGNVFGWGWTCANVDGGARGFPSFANRGDDDETEGGEYARILKITAR